MESLSKILKQKVEVLWFFNLPVFIIEEKNQIYHQLIKII